METLLDVEEQIARWLKDWSFRFNPFQHLEAAADPHLLRYLVVHEGLKPVWKPGSAFIFAPVGGGKTALRIYATWNGLRNLFSFFPTPYVLPRHWDTFPPPDIESHVEALADAIVSAAMLVFLAFPQRFLRLPMTVQQQFGELLESLSGEFVFYTQQLMQAGWENTIKGLAPPALVNGFIPPPERHVQSLIESLSSQKQGVSWPEPNFRRLRQLLQLLQKHFRYESIQFLVDGVDAFAETNEDARSTGVWLGQWLKGFERVFPASVMVKVFVPLKMEPALRLNGSFSFLGWQRAKLEWTPDLLEEVLHRRLNVASNGRFDSLDALSSSEIRDLDRRLAEAVDPLPRELIALTARLLYEHCRLDSQTVSPFLEQSDVTTAIHYYQKQKSFLGASR